MAGLVALAAGGAAHAHSGHDGVDGRWNLLVMRVDFSDAPGVLFSQTDFEEQWVPTLRDYYMDASNQQLDLQVTVLDEVIRLGPRRYYHSCRPARLRMGESPDDVCRAFWSEAADKAVERGLIDVVSGEGLAPAGGSASDVFDGIMVVTGSPGSWPLSIYGTCGSSYRSWWFGNVCVSKRKHGNGENCKKNYPGRYEAMISPEDGDGDCSAVIDPVTDVGPAVQELGHGISSKAGNSGGHPANYNNLFELMDNCYPCMTGVYTRVGKDVKGSGFSDWFPGWLPASKVALFDPPTGGTEVLAPIEQDPDDVTSPMGLRVGTVDGTIYVVECRRKQSWDDAVPIPDTGVAIIKAVPDPGSGTQETIYVTPPMGDLDDAWKPGETFTDSDNDVQIRIGDDVGEGCTVTVDYGPSSTDGVPDVGLTPWLTPPRNTWETVDIWVDSSCNGYEADGGELRYGRDGDGNVSGNGDDACANAENRVYAKVRNYGDKVAEDLVVDILVTRPLGVGIREADGWQLVGSVDQSDFPALASVSPGGTAEVWVPWTPEVDPPPADPGERFPFHSCLQVKIDAVSGERVLTNQDGDREQENIGYFEARRAVEGAAYDLVERHVDLTNDHNEGHWFFVEPTSEVPEGWEVRIGEGDWGYWVEPGETVSVPVVVDVPDGEELGRHEYVRIEGFMKEELRDETGTVVHEATHTVGGVLVDAHTVLDMSVDLDAAANPPDTCFPQELTVDGCLSQPVAGTNVKIFYGGPQGESFTSLVDTDANGCFSDALPQPSNGTWRVEAFWHGDDKHASAGDTDTADAFDPQDVDCDQLPNGQDNCPETANSGQEDLDNDGHGDACDCAIQNPDAWEMPAEVTGLLWNDEFSFTWDSLAQQAGPGTVYDVLRGRAFELPVGSGQLESCHRDDLQGNNASDQQQPPAAGAYWYLARGQNSCGSGTYGNETDGDERSSQTCP